MHGQEDGPRYVEDDQAEGDALALIVVFRQVGAQVRKGEADHAEEAHEHDDQVENGSVSQRAVEDDHLLHPDINGTGATDGHPHGTEEQLHNNACGDDDPLAIVLDPILVGLGQVGRHLEDAENLEWANGEAREAGRVTDGKDGIAQDAVMGSRSTDEEENADGGQAQAGKQEEARLSPGWAHNGRVLMVGK